MKLKNIILSLVVCSLFIMGNGIDDYQSEAISSYKAENYSKSLKNFQSRLDIQLKTLPKDSVDIAESYNDIGIVYQSMGDYSKAL